MPEATTSKAQEKYAEAIEALGMFLGDTMVTNTAFPIAEFEPVYKELRGLQKFWDTKEWDVIERECGDPIVAKARADESFKQYFKLRAEIDRLEVLVKCH